MMRSEERTSLHNIQVRGEAASADVEAAAGSPEEVARTINEDSYTKQ